MGTIIVTLLSAVGSVSIILGPILVGAYIEARKEIRRREEQDRAKAYADELLIQTLQDAVDNGVGGKVLKHLIETGQL